MPCKRFYLHFYFLFFLLFILARIILVLATILWLPAIDNGGQKRRVFKTHLAFPEGNKMTKAGEGGGSKMTILVAKLPPQVAKVPTRVAKSPSVAKTPN